MTNRVTRRIKVFESKYIHKNVIDRILTAMENTTIDNRAMVVMSFAMK